MPVNEPSKAYNESKVHVKRVRDCAAGPDAVKAMGETYLPRLSEQTNDEYNVYKDFRGYLIPVVKPTVIALTGAIMRKAPTPDLPANLQPLLLDSDGMGKDLSLVASQACSELFEAGRYGMLAEVTATGPVIRTYMRESIINDTDDFIVLRQQYSEVNPKDKFEPLINTEYLELTLDENGLYIQNIWRETSGKKGWGITKTIEPTLNGKRIDKIPFQFINTLDATPKLTPPALLQLSDVNLDQYRLSTDLRHGLHWTALPTMFVFGEMLDAKGKPVTLSVGAGSVNHLQDTDASAILLEFTGAGLGAIEKTITEDIAVMASVAAKMFQNDVNGVRAAETARIEQSGESATLSTIASAVESGIESLLRIIAEWSGTSGEISYKLNRDFLDINLTPQQLAAYLQMFQSESISLLTYLNLLHRGELLPSGVTPDMEAARIIEGSDFEKD